MLLTIGIPTFNRSVFLKEALNSVIFQIDDENPEIEIVICDNASTDNTKELCQEFAAKNPSLIRYYRHTKNLGANANVQSLFVNAQGKFVWILSDDDALSPGAIKKMVAVLKKYPTLKVIFSNYEECDTKLQQTTKRIRQDILSDFFCQSGDDFFRESKFLANLLSSVIIKKEEWLTSTIADKYCNAWLCTSKIIAILANPPSDSYVIADKLVKFRMGNATWCNNSKILFNNSIELLDTINMMHEYHYSKKIVSHIKKETFKNYPRLLLSVMLRSFGYDYRLYMAKKIIQYFWNQPMTWFVLLPELCIPRVLINILYRIAKGQPNPFLLNKDS